MNKKRIRKTQKFSWHLRLLLGLPFLWMSRGFSAVGKFLLTIAVLLWTALVLWVFYLIMAWCIPRIMEGLRALYF